MNTTMNIVPQASDSLGDALGFFRSVFQVPLQPPQSHNSNFRRNDPLHQHGKLHSTHGFTQQQHQWTPGPLQQQQQQQRRSASIPPQQHREQAAGPYTQQQQHEQHHNHDRAIQQPHICEPAQLQGKPHTLAGWLTTPPPPQQQQQQDIHQPHACRAVPDPQHATRPHTGHRSAPSSPSSMQHTGSTPAHADAQLQPTPTPHAHQQLLQAQHQQQQWQARVSQLQQKAPLQDVANLPAPVQLQPPYAQQPAYEMPGALREQLQQQQQRRQQQQQQQQPQQCNQQQWQSRNQQQAQRLQTQQQNEPMWLSEQQHQQWPARQQQQQIRGRYQSAPYQDTTLTSRPAAATAPHHGSHPVTQQHQQTPSRDWQQQQRHQQRHQQLQPQQQPKQRPQQQQLQQQSRVQHRSRTAVLLQRLAAPGDVQEGEEALQQQQQQQRGLSVAAGVKSSTRWPWLGQDRRDAQGRQPGSPGYDPSTLHIPPAALAAMSDFGRQFWGIKSRAMDLVLFVRHGSFYNLFDVDADVGLRVGLNLSGPAAANMWKVGCSKDHFATWAAKVLAQGYSVGRVEEMQRASSRAGAGGGGGGGGSKLLVRQLVRIYTPGTAVEGLLLDDQDCMPHPLLCLVEVPFSTAAAAAGQSNTMFARAAPAIPPPAAAGAAAVGICVLDITSGVCRVGCFNTADDPSRSALAVALLMVDPSEAVAVRNNLAAATVTLLKQHFELKLPSGPGFGSNGSSDGGSSDRASGFLPGVSWLPASAASGVLGPTEAVLQGSLSEEQLHQLQHIAASAAAAANAPGGGSRGGAGAAAASAAACAVLSAAAVGVRQLERCSLSADVLPTLEVQPLEALTTQGGTQPGRPLLLDNNAIITLDLLPPTGHSSSSSSSSGGGTAAAAATALTQGGAASTLFGLLDRAVSAAGRRKLRQWICRPLTLASASNERLDVLDLFLALPAAAEGLQQHLSGLPDADRLLPKAAAAVRGLLQQQQHILDAQQQQQQQPSEGAAGVVQLLEGSAAHRERAWKALVTLPACLMGLIEAVAALRREVTPHTNTAKLPLMRRAELAAARAVPAATAMHKTLANATWAEPHQPAAGQAAGRSRGKKAAAAAAAAAAAIGAEAGSGASGVCFSPGSDVGYDAAVGEQQQAQEAFAAELQAAQQWYSSSGRLGGWGQQQQLSVHVQEMFVADESEGVLGLVVHAPAAVLSTSSSFQTPAPAGLSLDHPPSHSGPPSHWASHLLLPGHSVIKQEVLQDTQTDLQVQQQQQHMPARPPTGRGQKAQGAQAARDGNAGRKGTGRGKVNPQGPPGAAATGPAGFIRGSRQVAVLLHLHVPELQELWQQQQQAEQRVAAAAASALNRVADTFLGAYGVFRSLVAAVADLDILAGFAQVVSAANAPPGCSFCRPQFAAAGAAAGTATVAHHRGSASSPVLHLEGLWHPLLGVQAGSSSSSSVVPNDVVLGGNSPGSMLLTGANMGGKSTLLRSTCVAVIMAQLGCYVPASRAVLEPVDAIFTRIGAADAIMCNKSTFMVEMSETAACLAAATRSSLIVLDELGRGTSTHDGYALAYAVLSHLARPDQPTPAALTAPPGTAGRAVQHTAAGDASSSSRPVAGLECQLPRVLFATHYHMLAQEPELQQHIQSCHMATRWDDVHRQLVHCYKLQPGPAPTGSCGIEVAALAGLPDAVVQRAAAVAGVMQEHCEGRGDGGRGAQALLRMIQQVTCQ